MEEYEGSSLGVTYGTVVISDVSDSDSDSESEEQFYIYEEEKSHVTVAEKEENEGENKTEENDSKEEDLPVCPICLEGLIDKTRGKPDSCNHEFCIDCLLRWASSKNTCPMDRSVFNTVTAYNTYNEAIFETRFDFGK